MEIKITLEITENAFQIVPRKIVLFTRVQTDNPEAEALKLASEIVKLTGA